MNRRDLIKAGVATGVAAAAWAAPTVRSASVVAFDGNECTAPTSTYKSTKLNNNCSSDCADVEYGSSSAGDKTINFALGTMTIFGPTCSTLQPTYQIDITTGDDVVCEVSNVIVYQQSDQAETDLFEPDSASTTGNLPTVPKINSAGVGLCNTFTKFEIECCPASAYNG